MINRITITAMLHVFAITEFPSTHLLIEDISEFSNEIYLTTKPKVRIKAHELGNPPTKDLANKLQKTFESYPSLSLGQIPPPKLKPANKQTLWATWFYVPIFLKTTSPFTHPLKDRFGNLLNVRLAKRDWCNAAFQGAFIIFDPIKLNARVFNFSTTGPDTQVDCGKYVNHPPTNRSRFAEISSQSYPFGSGGLYKGSILRMVPFYSIAASKKYPIGSVVYIPEARGTLIRFASGRTERHPGYFLVASRGGLIKNNHIDVFTGIVSQNPFKFINSKDSKFSAYLVDDEEVKESLLRLHGYLSITQS